MQKKHSFCETTKTENGNQQDVSFKGTDPGSTVVVTQTTAILLHYCDLSESADCKYVNAIPLRVHHV